MKIYFILFYLSISFILYSQQSPSELYEKMRGVQLKAFPVRYEAEIVGEMVDKQIGTVPASRYTSGRDKVTLKFYFKQSEKPSLVLENVDSFYRNMFGIFEAPLETTGLYAVIGVAKNYSEFSKRFSIQSVTDLGDVIEAKAIGWGDNKDYTVEYVISKENYLVESARYFVRGVHRYSVFLGYRNIENYTVPQSVIYTSTDGVVNSEIRFINVKTFSK